MDRMSNPNVGDWSAIAVARQFQAELRERAAESEAARMVPQDLARRLAQAGLHRLLTPRRLQGLAVHPCDYVQAIEALAQAHASTAWCTFISNTAALVGTRLNDEAARLLLGRPDVIGAGVFAPRGVARRTRQDGVDGVVVSGRWPWGSGSRNADYVSGGCLMPDAPSPGDAGTPGAPVVWSVVFDREQITIHDTWRSLGLRGTGSHDFEVRDVFVPAHRVTTLLRTAGEAPAPLAEPIERYPVFGLLAVGIAAVSLGIARCAIDALIELAGGKTPQGATRPLAQRAATQERTAQAEARLAAARAGLLVAVDGAWREALAGEITLDTRRALRAACVHTTHELADVVTSVHRVAGGSSVFEGHPIERCFRDAHTVTQHMMVGEPLYEISGRLALGLPAQTQML